MSKLLWMAFQAAIVGFFLYVEYDGQRRGEVPRPGLALFLGVTVAFVLTALPFIVKDVLIGQMQHWSALIASRRARLRAAPPKCSKPSGKRDRRVAVGSRRRELPKLRARLRVGE